MKTVVLAALVGLISWQAMAATPSNCAARTGKASGATMHEKRIDWASTSLYPAAKPAQPNTQPAERVAKAQSTDNRG